MMLLFYCVLLSLYAAVVVSFAIVFVCCSGMLSFCLLLLPLCCFGRYFFGGKILLINDGSTDGSTKGSYHSKLYPAQGI